MTWTACPPEWSERMAGWRRGACYRIDEGWFQAALNAPGTDASLPLVEEPLVVLARPALMAPAREGRWLIFAERAINAGYRAWRAFGLGTMFSSAWYVSFYNGLCQGLLGFCSAGALGQMDVMDVGGVHVVFVPEVLGPVARVVMDGGEPVQWEPACGLAVHQSGHELWVRGTQVADGYWHNGRPEPLGAEGGWLRVH